MACPTGKCRKGARCLSCIEAEGLTHEHNFPLSTGVCTCGVAHPFKPECRRRVAFEPS
jgi:hypothetical protein